MQEPGRVLFVQGHFEEVGRSVSGAACCASRSGLEDFREEAELDIHGLWRLEVENVLGQALCGFTSSLGWVL